MSTFGPDDESVPEPVGMQQLLRVSGRDDGMPHVGEVDEPVVAGPLQSRESSLTVPAAPSSGAIDAAVAREQRHARFIAEAEAARVARLFGALVAANERAVGLQRELAAERTERSQVEFELQEIKRSQAYRLGLAARRAKLAFRPRLRSIAADGSSGRQEQSPASEQPAIAPAHPAVSVIMPVFNKGRTLLESVRSVQNQTFISWELIVWDDGSTDQQTRAVLDSLSGPGIRVFRSNNQGVIAARNEAASHAAGEFLCFLDPDDLLSATYLEKAVLYLDGHADVALAYPWTRYFEGDDGVWPVPDLEPRIVGQQNQVPVCALMRREVFEATGGFQACMETGCEDWELWAHAAELGFVGHALREYLFDYRYSPSEGRDAEARPLYDEHRRTIMQLHPALGLRQLPARREAWVADIRARIAGQPYFLPHGEGRPILFFVPWLTAEGGAEAFLREVAAGLVAEGRTVVFIATQALPPGTVDGMALMQTITPYVYDLTRFLPEEHWSDFCASVGWRLHLPIVVNVGSNWLYDHLDLMRGSLRGPAAVVDILFNHLGHLPTNVERAAQIDHTVVVHEELARLLREHFAVPSQVSMIPVGIRVSSKPHQSRPSASGRLPVIGWLGRFSSEKRPEWFLRLAQALAGSAEFVMAGTGPLSADVAQRAAHIDNLAVLGFVESGTDFIDSCDLLVNTSDIEGISLVAMEAISRGVPVVSSEVGGMPDLVIPHVNGDLYEAQDFQQLVRILRRLVDDRGALAELQASTAESGLLPHFHHEEMLASLTALLT